jgi:hypothetical protein
LNIASWHRASLAILADVERQEMNVASWRRGSTMTLLALLDLEIKLCTLDRFCSMNRHSQSPDFEDTFLDVN